MCKENRLAFGIARTHGRSCGAAPHGGCPEPLVLASILAQALGQGQPKRDLPLLPNMQGQSWSKEAIVQTIIAGGRLLGVPLQIAVGSERLSSHSLRTSRAQGRACLGSDLCAIQLLGRWGSERVTG